MTRRQKSEYRIQTVSNALRLLEAFRDKEELGVTELGNHLGLHKNNVFRLLATLEGHGYVEQSPTSDRYRLGVSTLELGQAFARMRTLVRQARVELEKLASDLGECAHLGDLADWQVAHVAGERKERLVSTSLRVGQRLPAHCTALGKVLLACGEPDLPERYDRDVVRGAALPSCTPATLTDRAKFFEELRAVRAEHFAIDREECESGMCCVAAPIYNGDDRLVGALSVSAPVFRVDEERLSDEVLPQVRAAGERLSRTLGWAGFPSS